MPPAPLWAESAGRRYNFTPRDTACGLGSRPDHQSNGGWLETACLRTDHPERESESVRMETVGWATAAIDGLGGIALAFDYVLDQVHALL
ncbi:hypothetical protein GCM10020000_78860 [Streptomyces olivoverticillatus]